MIRTYLRLLPKCRTVNHLNRLHIALTERMTPLELREFVLAMSPLFPGSRRVLSRSIDASDGTVRHAMRRLFVQANFVLESYAWIDELEGWARRSGKEAPETFVRRRLKPNVFRLSNGAPTADKTLAICFTGNAGRLFMPISAFLQHLDANRFDVLAVRDPSRHGYRNGLSDVAPDFQGLVEAIGRMFDRRDYRCVVTYGTSGGGLPAIVTALRLGLDKGVAVAGRGPNDPRWQTVCSGGVGAMLRELARTSVARPNLLLVHGADSGPDRDAAHDLANYVPAGTLAVHGRDGQKMGHNALFPLLVQSRLREFLGKALDPAVAGFGHEPAHADGRIVV